MSEIARELLARGKAAQTARRMAVAIVSGELQPGSFLLSESKLSEYYEVSRPNVRQALALVAAAGLIEKRRGVGSFVAQPKRWNLLSSLVLDVYGEDAGLFGIENELVEMRLLVEVDCAGLAATRITAEDLDSLEDLIEDMQKAWPDISALVALDLRFHRGIATASNNRFLMSTLDLLQPVLERRRKSRIAKSTHSTEVLSRALEHHQAIIDALRSKNEARARATMRHHLLAMQTPSVPERIGQ